MKFIPAQLAAYLQMGSARRNLRALRGYLLVMLAMVVGYSVAFHWLMDAEGQRHS
jgi:hypothetical protein